MPKKWKPGPCDKAYGKFLDLDMFAEQINFNFRGRSHFGTCIGVLFTLSIVLITAAYGYYSLMSEMRDHEVPTVQTQFLPEYFKPETDKQYEDKFKVKMESEKDPFAIALAISSPNGYKSANYAEMLAIGTFSMTYLISGGPEDGKTFDIQFKLCTDKEWDKFHLRHFSGRQNTIIESHIKHDVFWCPDASDLSFWGHAGD